MYLFISWRGCVWSSVQEFCLVDHWTPKITLKQVFKWCSGQCSNLTFSLLDIICEKVKKYPVSILLVLFFASCPSLLYYNLEKTDSKIWTKEIEKLLIVYCLLNQRPKYNIHSDNCLKIFSHLVGPNPT